MSAFVSAKDFADPPPAKCSMKRQRRCVSGKPKNNETQSQRLSWSKQVGDFTHEGLSLEIPHWGLRCQALAVCFAPGKQPLLRCAVGQPATKTKGKHQIRNGGKSRASSPAPAQNHFCGMVVLHFRTHPRTSASASAALSPLRDAKAFAA